MSTAIPLSDRPFYLEPQDLAWGEAAKRAHAIHNALPLLGGVASSSSFTVWRPGTARPRQEIPASETERWLSTLHCKEASRARGFISSWMVPRNFPGVHGPGPAVMGVLNVTNDSFYPGSRRPTIENALAEAEKAVADGASILDVGGQSTRPASGAVSPERELDAVLPVIAAVRDFGLPVSVDTLRPEVALAGRSAGAEIINDISGLLTEEVTVGGALIIGDMRGNPASMQRWPRSSFGVLDTYRRLEAQVQTCLAGGMTPDQIAIDPGFGFGKSVAHNQALIHHLPLFLGLGVPIALGVSRKGSLGFLSGAFKVEDRLPASLAAVMAAVRGGACILRVHDVRATRQMLLVSQALG